MTGVGVDDPFYFEWLHDLVLPRTGDDSSSWFILARQLHWKPFRWSVMHDDNRAVDGRQIRMAYVDHVDMAAPCTMLELLIGLADHMAYETSFSGNTNNHYWFMKLLENPGLIRFTDEAYFGDENTYEAVDVILERIINRTYGRNGYGGLFPLRGECTDQRYSELWTQKNNYLLEHENLW